MRDGIDGENRPASEIGDMTSKEELRSDKPNDPERWGDGSCDVARGRRGPTGTSIGGGGGVLSGTGVDVGAVGGMLDPSVGATATNEPERGWGCPPSKKRDTVNMGDAVLKGVDGVTGLVGASSPLPSCCWGCSCASWSSTSRNNDQPDAALLLPSSNSRSISPCSLLTICARASYRLSNSTHTHTHTQSAQHGAWGVDHAAKTDLARVPRRRLACRRV